MPNKWLRIVLFSVLGLFLVLGLFFAGSKRTFRPETIHETTLAGQPALKVMAPKEIKEINPGYIYRIKHPTREDIVLVGTASLIGGGDLAKFRQTVESILNSIRF